jgi:hypothetical protein
VSQWHPALCLALIHHASFYAVKAYAEVSFMQKLTFHAVKAVKHFLLFLPFLLGLEKYLPFSEIKYSPMFPFIIFSFIFNF